MLLKHSGPPGMPASLTAPHASFQHPAYPSLVLSSYCPTGIRRGDVMATPATAPEAEGRALGG